MVTTVPRACSGRLKTLVGQILCFPAITAKTRDGEECRIPIANAEAFPRHSVVVSHYYVIAVRIPSSPARARVGGLVCRTIM